MVYTCAFIMAWMLKVGQSRVHAQLRHYLNVLGREGIFLFLV